MVLTAAARYRPLAKPGRSRPSRPMRGQRPLLELDRQLDHPSIQRQPNVDQDALWRNSHKAEQTALNRLENTVM